MINKSFSVIKKQISLKIKNIVNIFSNRIHINNCVDCISILDIKM